MMERWFLNVTPDNETSNGPVRLMKLFASNFSTINLEVHVRP